MLWMQTMPGTVMALARIADITGDGINEVVAGAWASRVIAFNGTNGDTAWVSVLPGSNYVMQLATLDDVNNDGYEDVAVGSWDNRAFVLSGRDGTQLWSYPVGGDVWTVARVGDVTGDGINDVVAGSFDFNVYVLDGTDGSEAWHYNTGNRLYYVKGVSDLTGNGVPDVFAGTQMLNGSGGRGYLLEGGQSATPAGQPVSALAEEGADGIAVRLANAFDAEACFVERAEGRGDAAPAIRAFREEVMAAYEEGLLNTMEAIRARRQDPVIRWNRLTDTPVPVASGRATYVDRTAEAGRTYTYRFALVRDGVVVGYSLPVTLTRGAVEVAVPRIVASPNPLTGAGSALQVSFHLPTPQSVRLDAYDAAGRRVATLYEGTADGDVTVDWAARDLDGGRLSTGVYFLRLEGENFVASGKATVLR